MRTKTTRYLITGVAFLMGCATAMGTVLPIQLDQLTKDSDRILAGTVSDIRSQWDSDGSIFTEVTVVQDVALKGTPRDPIFVTVRIPGGTVGEITQIVSDTPGFAASEKVLLFLKRRDGYHVPTGRVQGKYSLGVGRIDSEAAGADVVRRVLRILYPDPSTTTGRIKEVEVESYLRGDMRSEGRAFTMVNVLPTMPVCFSQFQDGKYMGKWSPSRSTYRMDSNILTGWRKAIGDAAATWSGAGSPFELTQNDTTGNVVGRESLGDSSTLAVRSTTLISGVIQSATITINSDVVWSTTGEAGKYDVQGVLTHEFGHWLGLADVYDAACSAVTMYYGTTAGNLGYRTLESADVDGIVNIYGLKLSLTAPAAGATGVSTTPTLQWEGSNAATSYDVYLGTANPPPLMAAVTTANYTVGTLKAGTTYYWTVAAKRNGVTTKVAPRSFTTGTPPGPFTLVAPANGTHFVTGASSQNVALSWKSSPGATVYDIYMIQCRWGLCYSSMNPRPFVSGVTSLTRTVTVSAAWGSVYYWRVAARNTAGETYSPVWWSFTIN